MGVTELWKVYQIVSFIGIEDNMLWFLNSKI